jgi:hypothetical protein
MLGTNNFWSFFKGIGAFMHAHDRTSITHIRTRPTAAGSISLWACTTGNYCGNDR